MTNIERKRINNGAVEKGQLPGYTIGTPITYTEVDPRLYKNENYANLFDSGYGYTAERPIDVDYSRVRTPITQNYRPYRKPTPIIEKQGVTDLTPDGVDVDNNSPKKKAKFDTGTFASTLPNTLGTFYQAFNNYKSKNELLAEAKTSDASFGGIRYQIKSFSDGKLPGYSSGIISGATAGATTGSVAGPYGAVIGGVLGGVVGGIGDLISSEKQEKERLAALRYIQGENNNALASASTQFLQQRNASKYGIPGSKPLYGFSEGKTEDLTPDGYTKKNHLLHNIEGEAYGQANAKIERGETGLRPSTGEFNEFSLGKTGKRHQGDNLYTNLRDEDIIFSDRLKVPGTSKTFAQLSKDIVNTSNSPREDLLALSQVMGAVQEAENNDKNSKILYAKNGKSGLLKAAYGWVPSLLGGAASLAQLISAHDNRPYMPNTYVPNRYENTALSTLAGLKVNPYPIMRQLRDAEARTNRAISMSGGLSGGQQTLARLSALSNTQKSVANALAGIQDQNNAYRSKYAEAALQAGNADSAARMQARQWDLDTYARAHAARNKGIWSGVSNLVSQVQNYFADDFKRKQFEENLALYKADQEQRKEYDNWYRKWVQKQYSPSSVMNTNYRNVLGLSYNNRLSNNNQGLGSLSPAWQMNYYGDPVKQKWMQDPFGINKNTRQS